MRDLKPYKGAFVAFCVTTTRHECTAYRGLCEWYYGHISHDVDWSMKTVIVVTEQGPEHVRKERVWSAMFTFAGPIRRSWDWGFP